MRQRNNQQVWTPAEMAIYKAMQEVEKMPAHVKLTDAVILLSKAQNAVADYLEEDIQPAPKSEQETIERFTTRGEYDQLDFDGASYEDYLQSKKEQKQSLIELMEADQRDGIYGVGEIESAIKGLEKGLEWIEPIRQQMSRVGRIKFVMNHAWGVLKEIQMREQNPDPPKHH